MYYIHTKYVKMNIWNNTFRIMKTIRHSDILPKTQELSVHGQKLTALIGRQCTQLLVQGLGHLSR